MFNFLKAILSPDCESFRFQWLGEQIKRLPAGSIVLDAGAGELRNKPLCKNLEYVSQDFCQYEGVGDGAGIQTGIWNTEKIDLVCDIASIPAQSESFDAILCTEVFEHIPEPTAAVDEFSRLLKPGGRLILTVPFASLVHFAPYHFCSGFSRYWYMYHLPKRGFEIVELVPNGDWFSLLRQELARLPSMSKKYRDPLWPLAYLCTAIALCYFLFRKRNTVADDLASLGWLCVAIKK